MAVANQARITKIVSFPQNSTKIIIHWEALKKSQYKAAICIVGDDDVGSFKQFNTGSPWCRNSRPAHSKENIKIRLSNIFVVDIRKLPPLLKKVMVVDHLVHVPLKIASQKAAVITKNSIRFRIKNRSIEIAKNPDCRADWTVTLQSIMAIVESKEVNGRLQSSKQVVEKYKDKHPWLNERIIDYQRQGRLERAISSGLVSAYSTATWEQFYLDCYQLWEKRS